MEVSVFYRGKEYRYVEFGNIMTWIDESQDIVPVMLHTVLREQAVSDGVESSVFLSDVPTPEEIKEKIEKRKNEKKKTKTSKIKVNKNGLMGGFNPFK